MRFLVTLLAASAAVVSASPTPWVSGGTASSGCSAGGQCVSNNYVTCTACSPSRDSGVMSAITERQSCIGSGCGVNVQASCACPQTSDNVSALACCTSCRSAMATGISPYDSLDPYTRALLISSFVCTLPSGTTVENPGGSAITVKDGNGNTITADSSSLATRVSSSSPCYPSSWCTSQVLSLACPAGSSCWCESCGGVRSTNGSAHPVVHDDASSSRQAYQRMVASSYGCVTAECCAQRFQQMPCELRGSGSSCFCAATGITAECTPCSGGSKKNLLGLLGLLGLIPLIAISVVVMVCLCCFIPRKREGDVQRVAVSHSATTMTHGSVAGSFVPGGEMGAMSVPGAETAGSYFHAPPPMPPGAMPASPAVSPAHLQAHPGSPASPYMFPPGHPGPSPGGLLSPPGPPGTGPVMMSPAVAGLAPYAGGTTPGGPTPGGPFPGAPGGSPYLV
eukprot:TRINITY_DN57080_c0_g1_i1.p1 TRINITY_DN57080_c0_g1~~TRINITY_DN57080_c0_g1_i1.p1  ORF type:complete len:451 (+),score=36.76 TRINITY_DN57080_c0_g1_i1:163-1515(+)